MRGASVRYQMRVRNGAARSVRYLGPVIHKVWGDKEWEANEGEQLASHSLSPQTVRIGLMYITTWTEQLRCPRRSDVELLFVAGQRLSLPGECQPTSQHNCAEATQP